MGVRRRAVAGGALWGLGEGLTNFAIARMKQQDDERKAKQQAEAQRAQAASAFLERVSGLTDPTQIAQAAKAGSMLYPEAAPAFTALLPTGHDLIARVASKLSQIKDSGEAPPDLGAAANTATLPLQGTPNEVPQSGSLMLDPSAQFGQMAPTFADASPQAQQLANAVYPRLGQLTQEKEQGFADLARKNFTEKYEQASGTASATHDYAPIVAQDKANEEDILRPGKVATESAITAGRFDTENTPERQRTKARGAGMTAGSEEAARLAAQRAAGAGQFAERADQQRQQLEQQQDLAIGALDTMSTIEQLMTIQRDPKTGQLVTSLKPGTMGIVGKWRWSGIVPGTAAADAQAALDRLRSRTIVDLLAKLKSQSKTGATGFGQLSEKEGQILQNAAAQLGQSQTEERFAKSLLDVYNAAKRTFDKANGSPLTGGTAVTLGPGSVANDLLKQP